MSHQSPVSGTVQLFSDGYVLSKAGSSFIRAAFREDQCWGGEDRHYVGSRGQEEKGKEVSNLEKVRGLRSSDFTQRTILTS